MIIRRLGGAVIRDSSSHAGAQALKGYFQALMRRGVQGIASDMERVLHETYRSARSALLENSL